MFECFIGLGQFYSLYLYIFYYAIISYLSDIILSFGFFNNNFKKGIFGFVSLLNKHNLIKRFYKNVGYIIFSFIFYKCFKYKNHLKKDKNNAKIGYELIYENKVLSLTEKGSNIQLLIVGIIFGIFLELGNTAYEFGFHDFDFWTFNIIFIFIFMRGFYKIDIYNHQKFSLIINFIINFALLLIIMFIPVTDNSLELIKKLFNNKLFCIPFILFYILNSSLISYCVVKSKILMEVKYILPFKIIFVAGCFGLFIISIILFMTGHYECDAEKNFCCNVGEDDEQNGKNYFDKISIYLSDLKDLYNNKKYDFFAEIIIVTPLFAFLSYIKFLLEILIIYYLNPFYILVSEDLYYIIIYSVNILIFNSNYKGKELTKLVLCFFLEVLSGIFYLVYLEMFELKFCGLDKNLKRKIQERGDLEISVNLIDGNVEINDEIINDEDNENEKNDNINGLEMNKF